MNRNEPQPYTIETYSDDPCEPGTCPCPDPQGECDCDGMTEVSFPTHWEVCSRCHGTGSHTNPSIDGNGLSAEYMHEAGPEFMEDYIGGVYDVTCYTCHGLRVEAVVDWNRLTEAQRSQLEKHWAEEAAYRAEVEAERRWGA
jgi:hypothetical protein